MVCARSCLLVSLSAMTTLACPQARADGVRGAPGMHSAGFEATDSSVVGSFLRGDRADIAALEGSFATSPPALSMPPGLIGGEAHTGFVLPDPGTMLAEAMLPAASPPGVPIVNSQPRLDLARLQPVGSSDPSIDRAGRRVKSSQRPDPFSVSRAALPLVVGQIPATAAEIRPMVGAVVGVRPAYVRPPSFE